MYTILPTFLIVKYGARANLNFLARVTCARARETQAGAHLQCSLRARSWEAQPLSQHGL